MLSPGQGWSQEQQLRLGWEQGAAGPAQGETPREGGWRPKPPRAYVFFKRDNFSSTICQENTQPACRRAPLLRGSSSGTTQGGSVGPGRLGFVQEEKHGISVPDAKGSRQIQRDLFSGGSEGKESKSISHSVQGSNHSSSRWNKGKSPSHAHHEPPWVRGGIAVGDGKAAGDAGNELLPSCCNRELVDRRGEMCPALQHPKSKAQLPPTAAHLNILSSAARTGDGSQTEPPAQGRSQSTPSSRSLAARASGQSHAP